MAIIQNFTADPGDGAFVFPVALVTLRTEGRWLAPKITHVFPGVEGTKHYLDNRKERPIVAEVHLYDRASEATLYAHLVQIEEQTNNLRGVLQIDDVVYPASTFDGIEFLGPTRWDPHHLWHRKCRLHWTQRGVP